MGASGYGILDDDGPADIYEEFLERFDRGEAPESIREALVEGNEEFLSDPVDGHLFWFGLAEAQWRCGVLQDDVLDRVREIIASGIDLKLWESLDSEKRRKVLDKFLKKLSVPRAKPRRPKKARKRRTVPAIYRPGDCLALRLSDGRYAAAVVIGVAESDEEEDGSNLLGLVRYLDPVPPALEVFERRDWLRLTHHAYDGRLAQAWCPARAHKAQADAITRVGRIDLGPSDPQPGTLMVAYSTTWNLGEQMIWQDRWDRGLRD